MAISFIRAEMEKKGYSFATNSGQRAPGRRSIAVGSALAQLWAAQQLSASQWTAGKAVLKSQSTGKVRSNKLQLGPRASGREQAKGCTRNAPDAAAGESWSGK